MIGSAE
jgi:hypothetical protein